MEVKGTTTGEYRGELGGVERTFRLGLGQIRAVEQACDAGLGELAQRLATWPDMRERHPEAGLLALVAAGAIGRWRVADVREPILQGLLGAGLDAREAHAVVKQWVEERPLVENVGLALGVVLAPLFGPEGDALGKSPAATGETPTPDAA